MAFLKYSLIRLALFAPLFALFVYLELGWLLAVLCAGMMAFAISFLFFQKQRDDADAEDRLVDAHPDITVHTDNRPKDA